VKSQASTQSATSEPRCSAIASLRSRTRVRRQEHRARGWSFNELVVTIAHDYWTWFGCSEPLPEVLEADQKAMGLDRRRYMQRVLNRRYHEILEKGPGFEKKAGIGGTPPGKK
jgi:hypothetical protein